MARECAVNPAVLETHLDTDYTRELFPSFSLRNEEAAEVMYGFLLERGYLEAPFDLNAWKVREALEEAYGLEAMTPPAE